MKSTQCYIVVVISFFCHPFKLNNEPFTYQVQTKKYPAKGPDNVDTRKKRVPYSFHRGLMLCQLE